MDASPLDDNVSALPRRRIDPRPISEAEYAVLEALRGIAYGQVEVTVHSSRIVQITRSQKLRFHGDAG